LIRSSGLRALMWIYAGEYSNETGGLRLTLQPWFGTIVEIPYKPIGDSKKATVEQKLFWKLSGEKSTTASVI